MFSNTGKEIRFRNELLETKNILILHRKLHENYINVILLRRRCEDRNINNSILIKI